MYRICTYNDFKSFPHTEWGAPSPRRWPPNKFGPIPLLVCTHQLAALFAPSSWKYYVVIAISKNLTASIDAHFTWRTILANFIPIRFETIEQAPYDCLKNGQTKTFYTRHHQYVSPWYYWRWFVGNEHVRNIWPSHQRATCGVDLLLCDSTTTTFYWLTSRRLSVGLSVCNRFINYPDSFAHILSRGALTVYI